jgi:hypothetical protein
MPDGERRSKVDPITGIGDKTRWTKPPGGAATVAYGDCKEGIGGWADLGDGCVIERLGCV